MPAALSFYTRLLGVLWLCSAWLVLTNHCALAGCMPAPQVHTRCAGCANKAENNSGKAPVVKECCLSTKAVMAASASLIPAPVVELAQVDGSPQCSLVIAGADIELKKVAQGSPPYVLSFAEQVVQQCLGSLAPPRWG